MCKYCEEGSKLSRGLIQSEIIKGGERYFTESSTFDTGEQSYIAEKEIIFFCPMCGQDLLIMRQRNVASLLHRRLGIECLPLIEYLSNIKENDLLETILSISNIRLEEVRECLSSISLDGREDEVIKGICLKVVEIVGGIHV